MVCVSDRDNPVTVYLTDEEKADLDAWANEAGKSVSSLLREAVREYTDRDRVARIEDKLDEVLASLDDDTHTHKPEQAMNQQGSTATERARDIVRRLRLNHEQVVKDAVVVRAIEDIAGVDDRTIRKYKRLFRKRGMMYEHPGQTPIWTFETDEWLGWMEDYARLNGTDEAEDAVEEYPAEVRVTSEGYRIEAIDEEIQQ